MSDVIKLRGVRQHNLKSVNLDIPKGKITVITGPSGCGKSSLAFHTIFAEGQRRYLEALSHASRKTLKQLEKPDFDFIDGLSPTIAIQQREQKAPSGQTVGMISEIQDYLRLLFSTIGTPHDPETGTPLQKLTSAEIIHQLMGFPEGTKLILIAPLNHQHFSDKESLKADLQRQGFMRVAIGTTLYELEEDWAIQPELAVVVDRLKVRPGAESRIADSLELALQLSPSGVKALAQPPKAPEFTPYSFTTAYHNPTTGFLLPTLEPTNFHYSTRASQCSTCAGLGREREESSTSRRSTTTNCLDCQGGRLRPAYLAVTLPFTQHPALNIADLTALTVDEILPLLQQLSYPSSLQDVITELVVQCSERLCFLQDVGLGYLPLHQWGAELSAGEYQRLRLSSQLGASLSGILYVLDEPSRGLHSTDIHRLVTTIQTLKEKGNTIIMVEHDPTLIRTADYMVDLGPGAGKHGGTLLAAGTPNELEKVQHSPTGLWLAGAEEKPLTKIPPPSAQGRIEIKNATLNNLQSISAYFPIGQLTVVDGPSGSGKSSLITHTLAPHALHTLNRGAPFIPAAHITGLEHFQRVVIVDQSPIGKSPRSNPATFTGLFDHIRTLFSSLPLSKQRGYQASRFSFNIKGGRCEKCLGSGKVHIALDFLNDAYVTCNSCAGARYNQETLEVRFKGRTIYEVLDDSIRENLEHFRHNPKLAPALESLVSVGLGYLQLGQPAHTLSGGEAQRVKIATELLKAHPTASKARQETTLYLLDEPTRGLHFMDIEVLAHALRSLLTANNTIVVIEHNSQFQAYADHRITLGEGGGKAGGKILYQGPA